MINIRKLTKTILLIALTTSLAACNGESTDASKKSKQPERKMQCLEQQSQCYFELEHGRVEVLFDVNKILAEQAFNISVSYNGTNHIEAVTGYMEGVEMFMGKIPLFLENIASSASSSLNQKPQIFQGEVLVGSCSAETMTWKIWLTFTMADQQTHSKMLTIVSHRS